MTRSWSGRRGARVGVLLATLVLAAAGCGGDEEQSAGGGAAGGEGPSGDLTIAYQPGIGYAQLLIMREQRTLEQALPNMNVSYKELASGAAIRDGMLAGEIQVGSGGVGPFLVGYDAGVGWKVLSALNQMDLWLMAAEGSGAQTLEELRGNKIAMPAPDSIQAIVLRRAAQEELGDAKALDSAIVAMPHPDALQALVSGQLDGHLTSPPFQFQEQDQGARKILGSYDYFGEHTFNSVFVQEDYHDDNPEIMEALYKGIQDATTMIEEQPAEAAALVAKASGAEGSAKDFEDWMTREGVAYATEPQGFIAFAEFMQEIGLMQEVPGSWEDLVFDNLKGGAGS